MVISTDGGRSPSIQPELLFEGRGVIEGLQYLFGSIGAIGVMGIGYYFGIYIYIQKLIHTYTFTPFVKHSLFRNGGTREIGDD